MKKILIIGATSEIAKTFISNFSDKYDFYYTTRKPIIIHNRESIGVDFNDFKEECFDSLPLIDGVIYCAGITSHTPVKLANKKHYNKVFDVNFYGAFITISTLLKKKKIQSNSSLVFLSSLASKYPYYGGALYTSSKLALEGLVKTLAVELSKNRVKVNAISPSFVESEMAKTVNNYAEEETLINFQTKQPFAYVKTKEVADMIHFLLSDLNKSITGQIIQIGNINTGLNN